MPRRQLVCLSCAANLGGFVRSLLGGKRSRVRGYFLVKESMNSVRTPRGLSYTVQIILCKMLCSDSSPVLTAKAPGPPERGMLALMHVVATGIGRAVDSRWIPGRFCAWGQGPACRVVVRRARSVRLVLVAPGRRRRWLGSELLSLFLFPAEQGAGEMSPSCWEHDSGCVPPNQGRTVLPLHEWLVLSRERQSRCGAGKRRGQETARQARVSWVPLSVGRKL